MSYFTVDVESDGPTPWNSSMVCFGAVLVKDMSKIFYGKTAPINNTWDPEALAISGFTREEHEKFDDPEKVFKCFYDWVKATSKGTPVLISDNPAYDFAWINYYFHRFVGDNPFGFSARRIGDLYCGLQKDAFAKWKHLRETVHDHNPVNDAKGNAEVLHYMKNEMGLKIRF